MKYFVRVNGEEHEVLLDSAGVHLDGEDITAQVSEGGAAPVRTVMIGTEVHRVVVRPESGRGFYTLWLGGHRFEVEAIDERTRAIRELSGTKSGPKGPAPLKAPMPGLIVRVNARVGDPVQAGQGLVVMEAMKMENELRATAAGRVKAVIAVPGTAVEKGALLIELE